MINTKQELKRIICVEKALYFKNNKQFSFARITKDIIPKGVFNVITGRGN